MEEEIAISESIIAISEEANGANALKILYMSAYFASAKNLHLDMFLCCFNNAEEELDAAIQLLQRNSLIESRSKQTFFIKNMVQKEIRLFLKQNGKEKDVLTEAINLQFLHLLEDEIHPNYIDHALCLLTFVAESDELVENSLLLPNPLLTTLRRHNRLKEAYDFGKKALKFLQKAAGEYHPVTLDLQHNLSTVLDALGQYTEAEKVSQELNEKDLKYSTTDEITKTLIVRAKRYCELSRYKEALPLYQTLLGERDVFDTFDGDILTAFHDYANLLCDMGRHSEAINILQDVLSQQKKVLVSENEYGLETRKSLAYVFQAQGNYVQAMKQLTEAFFGSKKFYGKLHPKTLRAERDIGTLLLHKGNYEESLKKLENVEKKFKEILPESHPDILCTRANIVGALNNLKEHSRALKLARDVYEAYKNIFGEKHNETLRAKHSIGAVLLKQRKPNQAAKVLQEVYEGFYDVFGPNHYTTVELRADLELLGCLPITLHAAAQKGDLNEIVSLIKNKADVNEADYRERRPLHYATSNGHLSVAKYLIKMGAMHNAEDFRGVTPYQLASDQQMKDFLISVNNLFKNVKKGMKGNIAGNAELVNAKDKNGYTLLHWATCNSHKHVVQELLEAGADPKSVSLKGNTPLHVASSKGHQDIAEILLQSVTGKDLNDLINSKTTEGGNTALHVAAENNDMDMVNRLLKYGAIYDIKNKEGLRPIQLSTDQSILDLLKTIHGVFSSIREGKSEAITELESMNNEELSIATNARNSQGHTLLQVAIKNQDRNITRELLKLLKTLNHSK